MTYEMACGRRRNEPEQIIAHIRCAALRLCRGGDFLASGSFAWRLKRDKTASAVASRLLSERRAVNTAMYEGDFCAARKKAVGGIRRW